MTDDNIIQLPASEHDPRREDARDEPMRLDDEPREQPDEQEPNRLMRDGPDAPDAADIEDPSEQL